MAITQKEADNIEQEFLDALPVGEEGDAKAAKEAWNHLVQIMARENNMTDNLGVESIDWQIGNWANDTTMVLHKERLYEEEIAVNEQILKINWKHSNDLFHGNAKRDIADAYADMGNIDKCFQLYDEYLKEDPLWGWAWIGYYRQLHNQKDIRFESTLDELYQKLIDGVEFRDKKDLCMEIAEEYERLGNIERSNSLNELIEKEHQNRKYYYDTTPLMQSKKIYPNDPCPCGSGKKYKKCCGRN